MATVISLRGVSKTYPLFGKKADRILEALHPFGRKLHKPFTALDGVKLDIRKGETVGIIGRNGSGKSTLLKIISGIASPTLGTVNVNGKISALLELGAGFSPEMTGRENAYFTGAILGYSREEMDTRMPEILSFAAIGVFADQPVRTYSSGMFVRLAFAVSISVDPDILIIDEALAVGDASFQAKCYRKFIEFKEAGKTIIFVSHGMDHILKYCDRAILLNAGKIYFDGSPREAVDQYKALDFRTINATGSVENSSMKALMNTNDDVISYGNGDAEIVDFGVFSGEGRPLAAINNGTEYVVKMKVKFHQTIERPIYAFTIRDLKGLDVTGTNTLYQNIEIPAGKAGESVNIEFRQASNLQPGRYAICLGCTSWDSDLVVHHRLYDALFFEAISEKRVVGLFDSKSTIQIQKSN